MYLHLSCVCVESDMRFVYSLVTSTTSSSLRQLVFLLNLQLDVYSAEFTQLPLSLNCLENQLQSAREAKHTNTHKYFYYESSFSIRRHGLKNYKKD